MTGVAVVTDSSACLPSALIAADRITVVPLSVIIEGETYRDRALSTGDFYARLATSRRSPTTATPAPGEFLEAFHRARECGANAVLCLTLSAEFSGAFDSATNARRLAEQELPGLPISVVDSRALAMAHGFAVLAAARAGSAGATLGEATAAAEAIAARAYLVGALETTRYLAKGGRVPWIVHWAASVLRIKPILAAEGEKIGGVGRARTMSSAMGKMMAYVAARTSPGQSLHVAVMHANAPERAGELVELVRQRFSPLELLVTEFTAVMGVHTGPGFVGLAFYSEEANG